MRILTVSAFFDSHGGGIERVAGHLCRQFAALGAESVWAACDSETVADDAVERIPLSSINPIEKLTGLPMPLPGLRSIRTLYRAIGQSDAVVIHDALYVPSIIAMIASRMRGKRVVLVQHIAGIPFSSPVLRAVMALANLLVTGPMLWAARERIFISDTVRDELLGTPSRLPCSLLFNGVDGAVFHPPEQPAASWAESGTRPRRILFVGRYVEKKGLAVLRALAQARPDLVFELVGDGPIRPEQWDLQNVKNLGKRTQNALADLYREADLLLLPSVGEGYPLVIQEAMACGLPVICGAPAHKADPGATAWLQGVDLDLTQPVQSAHRIAKALDRRTLSATERAAMATYARTRYDWRTMAQGVVALARGG